jgi:hypothetical protein
MPVVRELINRITFKVNQGDKAKAESAFSDMQKSGASLIGFTKGLTKTALASITSLTVAGAKLFTDLEKDQASVKFFSKTNEEAQKLLDIVDQIRGNEIISRRERAQAASIFSQLNIDIGQIEKALPILRDISIAQPKLDFPQTVELFAQFVKTGDIDSLMQLGAAGKELAEQLKLANVDISQSVKGQINRAQLLTQELDKQKVRISELAEEQKNTLTFGFRALTKEASDFTTKFGEKTAPAMKEIVTIARDLIKELNESEDFWDSVESGSKAILEILKSAISLAKEVSTIFGGSQEEFNRLAKEKAKGRQSGGVLDLPLTEAISLGFKKAFGDFFSEGARRNLEAFENKKTFNLELNGEIKVKGENLQGVDTAGMSRDLTKQIGDSLKEDLKAIAAQSGRPVATGGSPSGGF